MPSGSAWAQTSQLAIAAGCLWQVVCKIPELDDKFPNSPDSWMES